MNRIIVVVLLIALSANVVFSLTLLNAVSKKAPSPLSEKPEVDIAALEQRLVTTIDSHFNRVDQRVQQIESRLAEQQVKRSSVAVEPAVAENETASAETAGEYYFEGPVDDVFAMGFVDEYAWDSMEQQIKSMSREENKRFWNKMLAGIQSGEIQMLESE